MMTLEQLISLVERCTREGTSPFYRDLYGLKAGAPAMRINTWNDWLAIPFFSKKELMATTLPERSFPPWKNIDAILASSGTSGNAPVFSPWSLNNGYGYRRRYHDFKKATLSSILTPQQQAWILAQDPDPSRLVVLDPKHPAVSVRLAKAAGVDSMFIFLHHLPPLAEEMLRLGIAKDVRFIELVGESCSRASFDYVKRTFPNAVVASIYGSSDVETTPIGIPCRPMTGEEPIEVFHANENFYLEIADVESAAILPIRKDVEGDLIITTESGANGVFPLIRYRIGDTVRVVEEKCAQHGQWSFEVLGRTESDFVKLPGGLMRADEVEQVLRTLGARVESDIFELHQYERQGPQAPKLEFILRVEARRGVDLAVLAGDIAKLLRVAPDFTYAQGVAEGRYLPLRCEQLQKSPALAKRKRIIRH